jgi:hypothetical protein
MLENPNSDEGRHDQGFDTIASLPLGLVDQVFSYMEVADVFQYQRVSPSKALKLLCLLVQ